MIAALNRLAMARQGMPWPMTMGNDPIRTPDLGAALEAVRRRGDEMPALTRRWVEVNSYTANVAGVNAVGAMLREAYEMPGLACTVIPGGDGYGDHLVWRTPAAAHAPPILLIGHHDTVFPPGHFEGWREDGGRATGPGALDMKRS